MLQIQLIFLIFNTVVKNSTNFVQFLWWSKENATKLESELKKKTSL